MKKFIAVLCLALGACAYTQADMDKSMVMDTETSQSMQDDNQYAYVDSYRPITEEDVKANNEKWNTARMETRWQEYKGAMVRVQILLGDEDLREMRLRLMQNANGADVDADSRTILSRVAEFEMKQVCGRNAESFVIVYDEPSFETMRPTPYFDHKIEAAGATMREYGFRCIYKN